MNRTDKRENDRKIQKLQKVANKLTDAQLELIDLYAQQKADKLLDIYKGLILESAIEAMRDHRISIERAEKIINKTEIIIERKVSRNEYRGN